jgi:hypothetical protein
MNDCAGHAEHAERLRSRLAELRWCLANDNLERCADLATQALESDDYVDLVSAHGLRPSQVQSLLRAERLLHEALVHGDGDARVNIILADNLGFCLCKIEDWLDRLAGHRNGSPGAWPAQSVSQLEPPTPMPS